MQETLAWLESQQLKNFEARDKQIQNLEGEIDQEKR